MKILVGGGIATALGIIGILVWWDQFLNILAGVIPAILLLGGALAVYLGFDELKDSWKKEDEPAGMEDKPDEAPSGEPEAESKTKESQPEGQKDANKGKEPTASEIVLGVIEKSKEPVDTATLERETGFPKKKIHSAVYNLKKQGKIKSETKGFYEKA